MDGRASCPADDLFLFLFLRKIYVVNAIYSVCLMTNRDRAKNRVFADMGKLRQTVEALIDQGRYRITKHPREAHPEFSDTDRVAIVRWGGRDKPDRQRDSSEGVYLCWARHPQHGPCRAVYAVEETPAGDILAIISVMPEE